MVAKRRWQDEEACIGTGPGSPMAMSPCPDALNWLQQLAASVGGHDFYTAQWLRCAELNLLFTSRKYFASLQGHSLKSYHSYTRSSRETVWQRLCQSSGLRPEEAAAAANGVGPAPEHLLMLGLVMSKVFHGYPEAGAVRYTFVKPPWMFGWCSKWKHLQPEMSVVEVRAFSPGQPQPVSIFVPVP